MAGDHFYCLDPAGELAPAGGYEREGVTGFVFTAPAPGTTPLYRWWHPAVGDHFYCTDPAGELAPVSGYVFEGIACHIHTGPAPNTVPLFRWYHPGNGDHFYCTDPAGELAPASGYVSEGITGYLYLVPQPQTSPLHRWFQSGLMSNFTYDSDITAAQRLRLQERHTWAWFQGKACGALTAQQLADLGQTYQKAIRHSVSTDATANASATVNGSRLWINFTNLFPLGDNEIAQTLIHEMMHCAGYTHPARRDPPAQNPDTPGDNGPYYGTAPLQAELCIAGQQSDAATLRLMLAPHAWQRRACPVVELPRDLREFTKGMRRPK